MKSCLSSVIAVVIRIVAIGAPLSGLVAADVDVGLEFSLDGSTWSPVSPSVQAVFGSEAFVRPTVAPTGQSGLPGSALAVDFPTNEGEVLVSLESSSDLSTWAKETPGTLSVTDKEFYRADTIAFSLVSAGTFQMGSPESELGREPIEANETQHEVTLTKPFFIQQTEVTWNQWSEVRAWAVANGYTDLQPGDTGAGGTVTGLHPVTEVSWITVVKWLNALSEREGLTPCYTLLGNVYRTGNSFPQCDFEADGYRLPTEAEWEYACRAGTTTAFHSGEITQTGTSPVDPNLDLIGWYGGNSGGGTQEVALKQANAWGLYDMSGNVFEWCWDWYAGDYGAGSVVDPTGPPSSPTSVRVYRGGYWGVPSEGARSAFRNSGPPDAGSYSNTIGFRPVRTAAVPN